MHFEENDGISSLDLFLFLITPSLDFDPITHWEAAVTDLTHLSTLCVWHGKFGNVKVLFLTNISRLSFEMFLRTGGGVNLHSSQKIKSVYS